MAYYLIEDFRSGLDVRRSPWSSPAGTLQVLNDAHITRGGEVEKRKAFVEMGVFPAGTFGLAADKDGLVTFGSAANPGTLPAQVRYQRLQSPNNVAMTGVEATTLFTGRLYTVARFSDQQQWHFYDGSQVEDWGAGEVQPYMVNNAGIAQHLADVINARGEYSASVVGNSVHITGAPGDDFDVSAVPSNVPGGVDDQSLVVNVVQQPVAPVAGVPAKGEFAIIGGQSGSGNQIDHVRVYNGGSYVDLIASPIPFDAAGPNYTALNVVSAINNRSHITGYRAQSIVSRVIIYSSDSTGGMSNGLVIQAKASGRVVLADGSFRITGGTSGGADSITSILANGAEILGETVIWATSNTATAEAVAAQIRAYASSPKYTAWADGEAVRVSRETVRSDDPATITLTVTATGALGSGSAPPPPVTEDPDWGKKPPDRYGPDELPV